MYQAKSKVIATADGEQAFQLSGPLWVWGQGLYHHIDFCAEYLEKDGTIVSKTSSFCNLVQDFKNYSKIQLKK